MASDHNNRHSRLIDSQMIGASTGSSACFPAHMLSSPAVEGYGERERMHTTTMRRASRHLLPEIRLKKYRLLEERNEPSTFVIVGRAVTRLAAMLRRPPPQTRDG